jgi:hypothetical protein
MLSMRIAYDAAGNGAATVSDGYKALALTRSMIEFVNDERFPNAVESAFPDDYKSRGQVLR